jgi:hypothetical protein
MINLRNYFPVYNESEDLEIEKVCNAIHRSGATQYALWALNRLTSNETDQDNTSFYALQRPVRAA